LSTDINIEAAKALEIYALRWAVEVYFKEAKQLLWVFGRVKYPLRNLYRFCMLISVKHNNGASGFSEVRSSFSHNLRDISYATRLWQFF